jgi:hypothetical protein
MRGFESIRLTLAAAFVAFVLLCSTGGTAHALLMGQQVAVSFSDPSMSYNAADTVTVVTGPEFFVGDSTNISQGFLYGENIDIGDTSIGYHVRGDGPGNTTGWGPDAAYTFTILGWGPVPMKITGVTIDLSNVNGVALGSEVSFTDNSVKLDVGTLTVGQIAGAPDLGQITLNLHSEAIPASAVPEPGTLTLLALGGAGLGFLGLRRRRAL